MMGSSPWGCDGSPLRRPYLAWRRNPKRCAVPLSGRGRGEYGEGNGETTFIYRNDSAITIMRMMVIVRIIVIIVRLIVVLTTY